MENKQDKVILNKQAIIKRNEANKDYSKMMNKSTGGRGPGRGVYLGKNAKDRKGTVLRIWNYLGKFKYGLITVAIATIATSILAIFIPYFFKLAIDEIGLGDYDSALKMAIAIVVIAALSALVRFISRYVMVVISQRTVKKIRQDAFDKLQLLPVNYYDKNQSGDIVSRITNDVDLISGSLASVANQLITSIITLVGSLIMMFVVSWSLALVVVVFVPLMAFITMKIGKKTRKGFAAQQKHLGLLNGIIEESISGIRVIKLYGQEENTISEFANKNEELKESGMKAQILAGIIMPIITFMNNLIYLVIIAIGGLFIIVWKVALTAGDLAAITMYARQFVQPIAQLAQLFNTLQQGLAGAERVFTLIDEADEYINDGEISVDKLEGYVKFDDVSFSYDKDVDVLKNISFDVEKGKVIAIVGPTGSGKTTIINLLNRFYDIDRGNIYIDHKEIRTYKKDDLRNRIGVVLQDTNLFSGTVYENIIYGDLNATKEMVEQAAILANANDFIMKLPHGYQSEVYEGGKNFSHGERQLISIARTILSNPDILILDEATSNVDTRTEFKIQESMKTLMRDRTSFVIAHRLQTIRNASKIIVIKEGMLIESGTHHELLDKKGFYHELYTTQFKELEEDVKS